MCRTPLSGRVAFAICAAAMLTAFLGPVSAASAAEPVFDVKAMWGDTNLGAPDIGGTGPEHEHKGQVVVQVRNVGDAAGGGEDLTITDALPAGVTVTGISWGLEDSLSANCTGVGTPLATCVLPAAEVPAETAAPGGSAGGQFAPVPFGYMQPIYIEVEVVPGSSGLGVNTAAVSGGGAAAPDSDTDQVPLGEVQSGFGVVPGSFEADFFTAAFPANTQSRTAGDHPFELRANFDFNLGTAIGSGDGSREITAHGVVKTVEVTLPRGVIANPQATPKCSPIQFAEQGASSKSTGCPSNTQVGYLNARVAFGSRNHGSNSFPRPDGILSRIPIYSLVPPRGQVADFGFNAGEFVRAHIYGTPDPAQDYAIKSVTPNISSLVSIRGSEVTFWGVPGDPAHDKFRFYPKETEGKAAGASFGGAPIRPFFTNPMDCGTANGAAKIRADSYGSPGSFTPLQEWKDADEAIGCDDPRFRFEPDISLQPTDASAGGPTGLDVHLQVPQRNDEVASAKELYAQNGFAQGISTPPIEKAVVTLPEGMTISPSAAQGLGACSLEQIGLGTDAAVQCPDDSQVGTLTLHTPILPVDEQPEGFIYVAKQGENFFHNFLSIYLVIKQPERGILVKVPGKVDLDPSTGQIRTTFDDLPQFPVSDMQLSLKGGPRAALVNPATCGTKTIRAEFFSWHEPATPHAVESSYEISQGSGRAPCVGSLAQRPFGPRLEAGTLNPAAGTYSPFVLRLMRGDNDQELSRLGVTLPTGLAARFAGVAICPDAGIAQAEQRSAPGTGALELASPSCPAASQIGVTDVGAGVGAALTYVPGRVYLAGPYRGAPISIVAITPAVVGPFDVGVVAVRSALDVNPITAQGSATSDSLPQILAGIPVRLRDVHLDLDRQNFTLNPTSCAEKQIVARVNGAGGKAASAADDVTAALANRFQAGDCASLGFKPRLAFRLSGGTHRGAHPRLRAVVTYPKGAYANIARASVALPHAEFLDQGNIRTVCTRVQFAARSCPAGSIYGHAVATTPLFDEPLRGPVYLRSSSHRLPDLVAALRGPASRPVEIELAGRIDSVKGGIRTTFSSVPDAPVTKFILSMRGGGKGLLENSTNLCTQDRRALARLRGQNGKSVVLHPKMRSSCR
jgi:hypothetical protein